jgi:hypothetical protein
MQPGNPGTPFVEIKDHKMNALSLRLRELSAVAPQRFKLAASVAFCMMGLVFLLKILSTTTPRPVADSTKPVQMAESSVLTKSP